MAVIRCENGHFYDNEKYKVCPHCQAREGDDDPLTMPLRSDQVENLALAYIRAEEGESQPAHQHVELDDERTIGLYSSAGKREKVVGWLVCIEGTDEGCDYPLRAGFNRIGRGFENDVVLKGDMTVSREEYCSVVYEEKKNIFYLVPKAGKITYTGEQIVEKPITLQNYQEITVGHSKLRFVAFCTGEWKWAKEE